MARFGLHLPTFDPIRTGERRPIVESARAAEAAGLDAVWVGDHLWCPAPVLEATACLAAAAAATERVALGFSVLLAGLRHPAFTAKTLQTIAALAPGRRLVLGVGAGGEFDREFELAGVPRRERGRRLDEAIGVLPALLRGQHPDRPGLTVNPPLEPPIPTPPPIYIGGRGEAALQRAARAGDGWLPIWVSPERVTRSAETLGELAAQRGRQTPKIALLLGLCVDADEARARRDAEAYVRGQYRIGFEQIERWTPVGSAQRVADYIARHVQAGVDELILMPLTPQPLGQVERLQSVVELLG